MNASILRRSAVRHFARRLAPRSSPQQIIAFHFSNAAAMHDQQHQVVDPNDLRQRLTKLMEEKDCKTPKCAMSDEDLQDRVHSFQTRLEDARLSIQDCSTEMDDVDEELMQASEAVEEAFAAYMDLLDDLRSANAEQRQHYGEMSLTSAMSLKVLRQELDKILPKNKE